MMSLEDREGIIRNWMFKEGERDKKKELMHCLLDFILDKGESGNLINAGESLKEKTNRRKRSISEDLKRIIIKSRIIHLQKGSDEARRYLWRKVKENRVLSLYLIGKILESPYADKLKELLAEKKKRTVSVFSHNGIKFAIEKEDRRSDFDFLRRLPIEEIRLCRKRNPSVLVRCVGNVSSSYFASREGKRLRAELRTRELLSDDFCLIIFDYKVHRDNYHWRYGSYLSNYSARYVLVFNCKTFKYVCLPVKRTNIRRVSSLQGGVDKLVSICEDGRKCLTNIFSDLSDFDRKKIRSFIREVEHCFPFSKVVELLYGQA